MTNASVKPALERIEAKIDKLDKTVNDRIKTDNEADATAQSTDVVTPADATENPTDVVMPANEIKSIQCKCKKGEIIEAGEKKEELGEVSNDEE